MWFLLHGFKRTPWKINMERLEDDFPDFNWVMFRFQPFIFSGWKPVPYKSKSAIKKIGFNEKKSFSSEFESSKVGDYYLNSRLDFQGVVV